MVEVRLEWDAEVAEVGSVGTGYVDGCCTLLTMGVTVAHRTYAAGEVGDAVWGSCRDGCSDLVVIGPGPVVRGAIVKGDYWASIYFNDGSYIVWC